MEPDIDKILIAYQTAIEAKKYADTIVLETENISGTDYRFIWTTQRPQN